MVKRFTASQTQLKPDPKYHSILASKFINCLMHDGKKAVAQRAFYTALDRVAKKIKDTPEIDVFTQAVENVKPMIEVRSKRVGGATYQVPTPVKIGRQQTLAFRWILEVVRAKKGRPLHVKLADEFLNAFNKEGPAMTKRDNVHRMAEANKAFAHFAW